MDYDSLTNAERRDYFATVAGTHKRRVELVILTKDDRPVRSLTNRFLGGSINGDDSRTPVEVMDAEVFDNDYVLDWRNGEHKHFKARVVDARFIPSLDDWVECTVFTGPIWDFERTGPVVSLVAQGSERLAMGSVRRVFSRPRKSKATAVVRDLLKATGAPDRGLKIPGLPARLPGQVTVGVRKGERRDTNGKKKGMGKDKRPKVQVLKGNRSDTYWAKAVAIVHSLNRDLFSDGRGHFVMATPASRPTATLRNKHIVAPVTERRGDDGETPNTWLILGKDPEGPKKQIRAEVAIPAKHPLSAAKQAWHGSPYEITVTVENKNLKRKHQAIAVGARLRDAAMRELIEYEVQALPVVPWIRPGALFSVPTAGGRASVRARQWTLPLGPDASPLTIGANRRSSRR